ncbi:PAS domain-containing protein [Cupriavidus sp. D39]|uniref:PAS domain-containing protein n=1 Tax=Cupriavidus sp. D39 TaxID=2997877 RepID=UPI002271AE94|nr:PAS domain-containing protein [Cupriavidus sp. D39]MCY0854824.1 PAS domain-containing protein [Cupriavidus sp. D39]
MTSFTYDAVLADEPADWSSSVRSPHLLRDMSERDALALLEVSGALALLVDSQGSILKATETSAQLLDYPREYLLRSSILDIVSSEHRERLAELLQGCERDGCHKWYRVRFAGGISGSRWLDIRLSLHASEDGSPCLLMYGSDVTRWVDNEQRLVDESFRDP